MRSRNRGYYEDHGLPSQNWEWPKNTWFQGRLNYVRQQQRSRIQKTHLKTGFLPHTSNASSDRVKKPKIATTGDQSIPRSVQGVLSMNQRRAAKPEQLRINNASPPMPVRLYKEQNFIRLNLYRYLFGKPAVIALGFLIISSVPYLLFIHYQKPNDIAFYKGAVPEPGIDMLTFPQPTEVVTAGLQAKPIPSLDVDSSTHVSQRTDESSQPIVEPKAQEMIVATKTIPVETKEASRKASQYKTIRITPIRQEPHFASAVTKDIDAGTVVTVFEIEGDWLKIKTGSTDSGGYVRKEYVVPVS